ncbi:hypothetical protein [Falsibacillus albus]|uniref:hypothetical protein n=1 Tax=Falsibacillus albus TaxID=2478915 RepID=UPI0011E5C4B1|nr:hypothetical protein [Falsibacillus albus]
MNKNIDEFPKVLHHQVIMFETTVSGQRGTGDCDDGKDHGSGYGREKGGGKLFYNRFLCRRQRASG